MFSQENILLKLVGSYEQGGSTEKIEKQTSIIKISGSCDKLAAIN